MPAVWKPHVTVAAVAQHEGGFLMVEESVRGATVVNQPAGHLDPGESLLDAVVRETREETGYRFHPEYIIGVYLWRGGEEQETFMRIAFAGHCSDHDPEQALDDGILRACWMSHDELRSGRHRLRSPLVLACVEDASAGRRASLDILSWMDGIDGDDR